MVLGIEGAMIIVISLLLIIEGFIVSFNTSWTKKILRKMIKDGKWLKSLGIVEILIGVILLLFVISLNVL